MRKPGPRGYGTSRSLSCFCGSAVQDPSLLICAAVGTTHYYWSQLQANTFTLSASLSSVMSDLGCVRSVLSGWEIFEKHWYWASVTWGLGLPLIRVPRKKLARWASLLYGFRSLLCWFGCVYSEACVSVWGHVPSWSPWCIWHDPLTSDGLLVTSACCYSKWISEERFICQACKDCVPNSSHSGICLVWYSIHHIIKTHACPMLYLLEIVKIDY